MKVGGGADRLGWNAMPFARDDLDSNYSTGQQQFRCSAQHKRIAQQHRGEAIARGHTFVSIPEEACILAKGTRGLVGSQHQLGIEGGRAGLSARVDAVARFAKYARASSSSRV